MKNKVLTTIFGIAVFILIITVSISMPIYLRFFYYLQIEPLNITDYYDYDVVKTAYNQMLNYLTLPGGTFKTGALPHSSDFASHMKDVKGLFMLNFWGLIISATTVITLLILNKKNKIELCRPFNMSVSFISAVSIFIVIAIIGSLVAVDFSKAFTVFHKIMFPGKDNWLVDSDIDPAILVLPAEFFLNCAILIGVSVVAISLTIIIINLIKRQKKIKKD